MSRRVAFTYPATRQIVNEYSAGGVSSLLNAYINTGIKTSSGALGANELGTVLSLTGGGWVPFLICVSNSAVPTHTIRCQVIVDGMTAFDATSDSIASSIFTGMVIALDSQPDLRFNYSLVVKVASSQAGTDYVAIRYQYHLTS